MTVDGSSGIFPHQATSVTEKYYNGAYYVNLQYETSEGNSSIAQFSFLKKTIAKQFVNTIVLFMGDGLQLNLLLLTHLNLSWKILKSKRLHLPLILLNARDHLSFVSDLRQILN